MKQVVESDGPRKVLKLPSRGWYGFKCTDCRVEKWFGHRIEAEDMFDSHDCGLENPSK